MKKMLPTLHERLAQLIATPSVSSPDPRYDMGNLAVINLLAEWLEPLGFAIHIQELGNDKANLVATFGAGSGGVILSGHSDTVPCNESRWKYPPFQLTDTDGRYYGLGSCDMKSFFAVAIEAALPLLEGGLKQPLTLLATADEESSMAGARALTSSLLPKARVAIIGEPTSLRPVHMHKSIQLNSLTVVGKSGHSSRPDAGINAIDAMHEMISVIREFRTELAANYRDEAFAVPIPTMNLGAIHGGDSPNRICQICNLLFDLRALPGMDNSLLHRSLYEKLEPVAQRHRVEMELQRKFPGVEAFRQERQSELVRAAENLSGHAAESAAYATEAPFLKQAGFDTVIVGPGSIDQAHQPDEYITHEQVTAGVGLFRKLIAHYCLTPPTPSRNLTRHPE